MRKIEETKRLYEMYVEICTHVFRDDEVVPLSFEAWISSDEYAIARDLEVFKKFHENLPTSDIDQKPIQITQLSPNLNFIYEWLCAEHSDELILSREKLFERRLKDYGIKKAKFLSHWDLFSNVLYCWKSKVSILEKIKKTFFN